VSTRDTIEVADLVGVCVVRRIEEKLANTGPSLETIQAISIEGHMESVRILSQSLASGSLVRIILIEPNRFALSSGEAQRLTRHPALCHSARTAIRLWAATRRLPRQQPHSIPIDEQA
jgi:hypothetical protein